MYVTETRGKKVPWIMLATHRAKQDAEAYALLVEDELDLPVRIVTYQRGKFAIVRSEGKLVR